MRSMCHTEVAYMGTVVRTSSLVLETAQVNKHYITVSNCKGSFVRAAAFVILEL